MDFVLNVLFFGRVSVFSVHYISEFWVLMCVDGWMDGWIDGKIHRYIDRKIDRCTRVSRVCFMQQHHTETKTIGTSTSKWHIFQYQNAISRKTEPNHGHRKDWFLQILWSLIIWFTPLGDASRWNGGAMTIPQSHTHPWQGFVMKYLAGVMSLSFHYSFFLHVITQLHELNPSIWPGISRWAQYCSYKNDARNSKVLVHPHTSWWTWIITSYPSSRHLQRNGFLKSHSYPTWWFIWLFVAMVVWSRSAPQSTASFSPWFAGHKWELSPHFQPSRPPIFSTPKGTAQVQRWQAQSPTVSAWRWCGCCFSIERIRRFLRWSCWWLMVEPCNVKPGLKSTPNSCLIGGLPLKYQIIILYHYLGRAPPIHKP